VKIIKTNNLPEKLQLDNWHKVLPQAKSIIKTVRKGGDKSLRQLTKRFDNITLKNLEVSKTEIKSAYRAVPKEVINSLTEISGRLKAFALKQMKQLHHFEHRTKGCIIGQRIIPIDRVGVYVPGGQYPLPSSALMGVVPAVVAGVREIIVCNPRTQAVTIVAADIAGADRIFKLGGVQAIAAMAYGTETIPRVDKIVGPGNRYVTAAKYIISGDCGIDMLAGPSEIIVIADKSANPSWIAADLIAQAEHDIYADIYCLTPSNNLALAVQKELDNQIKYQPNKQIIQKTLKNGAIVLTDSIDQCIKIANQKAPEHLALHLKDPYRLIKRFTNYGTLFLGGLSAVAFGDYVTGSNHILPTAASARYSAGLSVLNFIKCSTYQSVTAPGLKHYINLALPVVRAEGLYGHMHSMIIRTDTKK
jgi:histidinol dehydrogenase